MRLNELRIGAIGGTVCSIWASITLGNIVETALTAAVGALVSVAMSQLLGRWTKRKSK